MSIEIIEKAVKDASNNDIVIAFLYVRSVLNDAFEAPDENSEIIGQFGDIEGILVNSIVDRFVESEVSKND